MTNFEPGSTWSLSLIENPGFQNELAQIRAKAVLTELLGEAPSYNWSYVANRIVRNATAALLELQGISLRRNGLEDPLSRAALQVARVWESLAKLEERTSRETALINAAAAYELAGYQANAAYLAKRLCPNPDRVERITASQIVAIFLQRYFLRVMIHTDPLPEAPNLQTASNEEVWNTLPSVVMADILASASRFFLSGREEALDRASDLLNRAGKVFASLGLVKESNLADLLNGLVPLMASRSTWRILGGLVPTNARWVRFLKLLARGAGRDVVRSVSFSELWPSQRSAVRSGLFSSSNKVINMPTSAGKTRIAELAIAHTLVANPGSKCVYIAPYRALVAELEETFVNIFADVGFRVSTILGTFETDEFEQLLASDADILVVTPEKMDLLRRLQPEFLEQIRLIILDEGQMVHDRTRGVKFELLLTRLLRRLPNARFISLSAVLPTETLEDFAHWLRASPNGIITSDWRPAVQRYAYFEWVGSTGVIRYSQTEDIQILPGFVSGIVQQRRFAFENPRTGRTVRPRFPEPGNKSQTVAELAFRLADLGPVLVFCSLPDWANSVGKALLTRIEYAQLQGETVPPHFRPPPTRSALIAEQWLGEDHIVARMLRAGIAIHHGDVPNEVRKAVEVDFRERKYQVIAATNTLAQGVNLPIRTVLVHSCWRRFPDGTNERIPARDYWNIAGRAGRAREETEGTIIHITHSLRDRLDFKYYLGKRTNPEPVESALFQFLRELVDERLSEDALAEALDPEILALLAEESFTSLDEFTTSVLQGTLVAIQAARQGVSIQPLHQVFRSQAERILSDVEDPGYRSVFNSTGLRTPSCMAFRRHVEENVELVRTLLLESGPGELANLAELLVQACTGIQEMQPEQQYAGSYVELVQKWLSGASVSRIRNDFMIFSSSAEELGKFIEDFVRYRLPWGVSGYLRVAAKVLGVPGSDLSPYARFFPSMLKFGVPMPEAAWAMTAGVPIRSVAIRMASKYRRVRGEFDHNDFLRWLGSLEVEQLERDYALSGPLLADVTRALRRVGVSAALRETPDVREMLPMVVPIRGIAYGERRSAALIAKPGMSARLVREYDNLVDRNAIGVFLDGQELGYLPRETAQLLAPEMDAGTEFASSIDSVKIVKVRVPRVSVLIESRGS